MVCDHLHFQGVKERSRTVPVPRLSLARASGTSGREDAHWFFVELFRRVGLTAAAYRNKALERRVPACLRFLRVKSLEEAQLRLRERPELLAPTLSVALLGVTDFGRDRAVFDQLRASVLPDLASSGGRLRVWSAACSDGRELYSVAILLSQAGLLERAQLLGTDCRPDAIEMARRGEFSVESLLNVDQEWRSHFAPLRCGVRAADRLRASLTWKQADLLAGVEPGPWDLLLWRNMAIYLEARAAEGLWRSLIEEVAPGGYLVTGKADHPPTHPHLDKMGSCIYRKRRAIP